MDWIDELKERVRRTYETGRISFPEYTRLEVLIENLKYVHRLYVAGNISLEEFEKRKKDIDERLQLMDRIADATREEESIRKEHEAVRPYNIDKLPLPFSKRVFVGGSYKDLPTLRQIAKYLEEKKFMPIIALDFDRPKDMTTHDFDLLLLHNCKYAVFELSIPAGQYIEVEGAFSYGIKTYGVCKAREKGSLESKKLISTMVRDLFDKINQKIYYYSDFKQLRKIIHNLFPKDC